MDNINFTGGFLISNPGATKWKNIKKNWQHNKVVFESFYEETDKFISTKTHYDLDMLNLLLKKKVDFKFYPDINLKSRLNPYYPEEAKQIVRTQTNVLENRKDILAYKRALIQKAKAVFKPHKYKWTPNDHIPQTFKALKLDSKDYTSDTVKGITTIYDKNGEKIAIASANSTKGFNYVYVLPQTSYNSEPKTKRYIINEFGEIEQSVSVINREKFKENFDKAVRTDRTRIRPKKYQD